MVNDGRRLTLHVHPDGCDRAVGTKDRPLATLAGARDAVRKLKRRCPGRDITVRFAEGVYPLDKTVVFGLRDSAPDGCTITYTAEKGARPVFCPDVPIVGWKKATGSLSGLAAKARGKVYVAPLPVGLKRFYTLYDSRGALPRATVGPMKRLALGNVKRTSTLRLPVGRVRNWGNLPDVEVRLCLSAPWTANVLPVRRVDVETGTITVATPPTYPVNGDDFERFGPRGSTCIENTFEGLTAPGRWVLDTRRRKIYLWPRKGKPGSDVVAPALTELIRIEGRIDYDGPHDSPVTGLVFRGLTFTRADRYAWPVGHRGRGMQHDWELHDSPSAMVRFRGTERCIIEHCHLTTAGSTGVRLDLHCQHNRICDNRLSRLGGAGIVLGGYGPGTKNVNGHNEITGNRIDRMGTEYWHGVGVLVWQSGRNRIANNLIHHMPYSGMVISTRVDMRARNVGEGCKTVRWHEISDPTRVFEGSLFIAREYLHTRDNLVEHNEIHHVMQKIFDGNGIYISTVDGRTMCRENFVHHCPSHHMQAAMRSDQPQDTTRYHRNVIWRCGGAGIGIVAKGPQEVIGNLIAEMHFDRQDHWAYLSLMDPHARSAVIHRNILYATAPDHCAYLGQTAPDGRPIPALSECNLAGNLYWNTSDPHWGERHLELAGLEGVEARSRSVDPLLTGICDGDFRLGPGSAALAMGFEPIDVHQAGPQDPARARRPSD